jgi:hypothetical protein
MGDSEKWVNRNSCGVTSVIRRLSCIPFYRPINRNARTASRMTAFSTTWRPSGAEPC